MIITKTPYRVSLFGGGTDHPAWYREHGGEVLSFAIDKYCYISTRILPPFFNHKYRIVYSEMELPNSVNEIKHPAVREGIRKYAANLFLEVQHHGDLPARSGVGSSSAFAVGLIHSLYLLQGKTISASDLATQAITLEQDDCKETVGSQDQVACALGGMNYLTFGNEINWQAESIKLSPLQKEDIEDRMVLIYSGINRLSSDISKTFLDNLDSKKKVLVRTAELARESRDLIKNAGDLDLIGAMLQESWSLKRQMNSQAVTSELEDLYARAQKAGALGGKILGAGGGGFCMFWVKSGEREDFLSRFNMGVHVPAKISITGSTCILKN